MSGLRLPVYGDSEARRASGNEVVSNCGVSMGRIGTLFGVSTVSVLRWVRAAGEAVSDPVPHAENGIVMLDEMWHFVNGKKTKSGSGEPLTGCRVALLDGHSVVVMMRPASR